MFSFNEEEPGGLVMKCLLGMGDVQSQLLLSLFVAVVIP